MARLSRNRVGLPTKKFRKLGPVVCSLGPGKLQGQQYTLLEHWQCRFRANRGCSSFRCYQSHNCHGYDFGHTVALIQLRLYICSTNPPQFSGFLIFFIHSNLILPCIQSSDVAQNYAKVVLLSLDYGPTSWNHATYLPLFRPNLGHLGLWPFENFIVK